MKKFLSFILAFVMVFTTFVSVIPPLEVSAATVVAPTVSTLSPNISGTKVTMRGEITDDGNGTITEYGFSYSINGGDAQYKKYTGSLSEGTVKEFSYTAKAGDYGWYYFYAKNSSGTRFSSTRLPPSV